LLFPEPDERKRKKEPNPQSKPTGSHIRTIRGRKKKEKKASEKIAWKICGSQRQRGSQKTKQKREEGKVEGI